MALPHDATFYNDTRYVPIVFDAVPDGVQANLLRVRQGLQPRPDELLARYEVFARLCADRAQRAAYQSLIVDARVVTPERYLKLWREAVAQAITPTQLHDEHGLSVIACLEAPAMAVRGATCSWTSTPWPTFDELREEFAAQLLGEEESEEESVEAGGETSAQARQARRARQVRLELDLRLDRAASAMFYATSMFSRALGYDSDQWQARLELRGAVLRPQPASLFDADSDVEKGTQRGAKRPAATSTLRTQPTCQEGHHVHPH